MTSILLFCLFASACSALLQTLPPIEWPTANDGSSRGFQLSVVTKTVYIEAAFASRRDQDGLTLIPPSANEFAATFVRDLVELSGDDTWELKTVNKLPENETGIFLGQFTGDSDELAYENGLATEEGYEFEIDNGRAVIRGAGARGMWWGTRTFLQLLLVHGESGIPNGSIKDAPAYATRGFMLDAGRKWYSPSFLKELCTYASFFKMSEFQYHTSDNYPLNRGYNETWNEVYSQFSLRPENDELQGIIQRVNETLSRRNFEDLQEHCAQRGVTIIPEIEAPGHCLFITKWKPELALAKRDLLNLTHPESIPLVKSIWDEFLPWFQTKEVHIGADEYDPTLADDYILFVNEMSKHINSTAGKRIRIWGTHEPSENFTISKDVIIQHWQYGQSDPLALQRDGYEIINSEDWWAYMSLKSDHMPILPARYPQFFNISRVLNFADKQGWAWEPALFNPFNQTQQLQPGAKGNKGAIMAAWNDNGPDATTQLEAYYAMRDGISVVAAQAWAGARGSRKLEPQLLQDTLTLLTSHAPGQNIDRRLLTIERNNETDPTNPLLTWKRNSSTSSSAQPLILGHGSKGMNYTLSLNVSGPFTLSSNDTTLSLCPGGHLTFTSDNWVYPLRSVVESDGFDPGHPGRIWINATSSTHEPVTIPLPSSSNSSSSERKAKQQVSITISTDVLAGSRVWVDGKFTGRFEVFVFGGRNTQFSWNQMAFVAPLDRLEGDGLVGFEVGEFKGARRDGGGDNNGEQPPEGGGKGKTGTSGAVSGKGRGSGSLGWRSLLVFLLVMVA
ncbi:hypothetical protein AJ80_00168 [Polytolypa hystricis UAMH7299]|uniref:beta-N-acetylhexosaminidase n=1 Tax=Polytolypa hystricis (strain UAMH7299) TaxID=1447883 RepID=A0A2B7Z606_POLH7|nr:hypothetical protein AJ80_00168 [Polytolypa hystricis UAMH7299]